MGGNTGASGIRVGKGSLSDALGVDIQATEVEVDVVPEALAVAVAAGTILHPLDAGVDSFGPGVGHSLDHRSGDSFQVLPNHAGHTFDRFQAATDGRAIPGQPGLARPDATAVVPQPGCLEPSARRHEGRIENEKIAIQEKEMTPREFAGQRAKMLGRRTRHRGRPGFALTRKAFLLT